MIRQLRLFPLSLFSVSSSWKIFSLSLLGLMISIGGLTEDDKTRRHLSHARIQHFAAVFLQLHPPHTVYQIDHPLLHHVYNWRCWKFKSFKCNLNFLNNALKLCRLHAPLCVHGFIANLSEIMNSWPNRWNNCWNKEWHNRARYHPTLLYYHSPS